MLIIDWLSADSAVLPSHCLADVRDVAMAADLAYAMTKGDLGDTGFAIKDTQGATLYLSTQPRDAAIGSSRSSETTRPALRLAEIDKPGPASLPGGTRRDGIKILLREAGDTNPVRILAERATEKADASPRAAELEAPNGAPVLPLIEIVAPNAPKTSGNEPSESIGATRAATVSVALASATKLGRDAGRSCHDLLTGVSSHVIAFASRHAAGSTAVLAATRLQTSRSAPPGRSETVEASAVAQKLGLARLVSARPEAKRRSLGHYADFVVLGATAALLLFAGPPIYSIYSTMSQVKAAEGRVIGKDIDLDHLRGSLHDDAVPAQLAEGRSAATGPSPVRRVGFEAMTPGDVVGERLETLAGGPAFAAVSTGGRIDFRKLFWRLRFVSASEIGVRLHNSDERDRRQELVFRRTSFWQWKLFDLRSDRDT